MTAYIFLKSEKKCILGNTQCLYVFFIISKQLSFFHKINIEFSPWVNIKSKKFYTIFPILMYSTSTCWESLVMSTGLILLKADNLSSLSLACCSTAMTKASCTWLFSASSLAISNWTNNVTFWIKCLTNNDGQVQEPR